MKNIFEFNSYLEYLRSVANENGIRGGVKTKLARAMGSHPAFLSRVLAGKANLSLDQADAIARHLNLSGDERRCLIYLVEEERAASSALKTFFREERAQLAKKQLQVREKVPPHQQVRIDDQARYYSAWYYGAVHVLASIGCYQSPAAIAEALALPLVTVREVLAFLHRAGILRVKNGKIRIGSRHLHLDRSSPLLRLHHANWRQKSIQALERAQGEELRYSAVFSLSKRDAEKIRGKLLEHLKELLATVESSPEEACYVLCLDFFDLLA